MGAIQQIFTQYAPEYLQRYKENIPKSHIKVLNTIIACRTAACGLVVYDCTECGQVHTGFRSCGNRHCTVCQNHKTQQWLQTQLQRQLPGHHFMITFTVPEQLRHTMRSHQRGSYAALFAAASQTIKLFAADRKYIGGDLPGFFGVLHTWGSQLPYHPHIHVVVPGGALSKADGRWHASRIDYFAPVKAMSKIFKAKLRAQMQQAGFYADIDPRVWQKNFNVNSQALSNSHHSLRYLAPYVFKVAISDRRIVKVENRRVYFRYRKPRSQRWRIMALDVMEFIRRFLLHVLPRGFVKIRYYGFMSPGSSVPLERIRSLIELAFGFDLEEPTVEAEPLPWPCCPDCGGRLKLRFRLWPFLASGTRYG